MQHLEQEVRRTVQLALVEDSAARDITSEACVSQDTHSRADFVLKQNSKIAGLRFLPWICETVDSSLKWQLHVPEGGDYNDGTVLASIEGSARSILSGERTALNLLQHTSGIAHVTTAYVNAVKGFNCDILDTRKTLPGLRAIQKYAVALGGGKNHRFDLEERVLIKNNHLALLKETSAHPVRDAIRRSRILQPQVKIEIEVENLSMLEEALAAKADVILLDNMPAEMVAQAVKLANGQAYLEASGGITIETVREYAAAGVNGISIGALTHSVKAVDISLRM
ncbi:MAG: carboxylating nicotinate-nucleotide diphosphorylase [Candidatus Melainabacteria bacterium]|nr:carboxylating nicotinate-nucleotide diphosphorylase [Candidatus Melainabacteria bacterium]